MNLTIKKYAWLLISILGLVLLTIQAFSTQFEYLIPILKRPTLLIVILLVIAGLIYLVIIKNILLKKITFNLVPLFFIGLVLRLVFLQSTPIYEDDFYRYFFDGSLTTHGLNPYNYAPEDALKKSAPNRNNILGLENKEQDAHPDLHFLAEQSLMERVAYPHIRTIYPPVTQAVFALSYFIEPFSLIVWRALLLISEIISFFLLVKLLKCMNKPMIWSAIYWLNPLLITETINAAHMDALLVPLLLSALLLAAKKSYRFAGLALALAVGVKVWPILLIPSLFRPLLTKPKELLVAILPCLLTLIVVLIPQLLSYTNEQSGLMNYSQYWRTNSFLFGLLENSLIYFDENFAYYFGDPQQLARLIVGGIISLLVIFQLKNSCENIEQLIKSWLVIITCLFLLSPTGYPWYLIWFLPLLAVKPSLPLLSLTMLLPLYNLRYPLNELNKTELFNDVFIPLQFLPPILFLFIQWYRNKPKMKSLLQ